jgi:hypothetical protein
MNNTPEFATNLLDLPTAGNVSEIDTDGAEDMVDREGFTSVSFTSIPARGFDQFKDIARSRGMFPRDLFSAAIRQLLQDREGAEIVYLASRKGGVRRSLWLEDDLLDEMNAAAQADNVGKTAFFLTALKRFADREGIDVEI